MHLLSNPADLSDTLEGLEPRRQPTLGVLHPPTRKNPLFPLAHTGAARGGRGVLQKMDPLSEGLPLRVLMGETRRAPGAGKVVVGSEGARRSSRMLNSSHAHLLSGRPQLEHFAPRTWRD